MSKSSTIPARPEPVEPRGEVEIAVRFQDLAGMRSSLAFLASRRPADVARHRAPFDVERKAWALLLATGIPMRQASRVYLGSEFCSHLAWTREEWALGLSMARDAKLRATLVLGVLDGRSFGPTLDAIAALAMDFPGLEVVANDWGALSRLSSLGVIPVAGRMLFRMKRLPRLSANTLPAPPVVPAEFDRKEVRDAQLKEFAAFPWDTPWMLEFARKYGVARIDTEMVPQGISFSPESPLAVSLHLPWTYVTGGGVCPVASFRPSNVAFYSSIGNESGSRGDTRSSCPSGCSRACRDSVIIPEYPTKTWQIVQTGHTVFSPMLSLLSYYLANTRYDRYILEPSLPM